MLALRESKGSGLGVRVGLGGLEQRGGRNRQVDEGGLGCVEGDWGGQTFKNKNRPFTIKLSKQFW